jgi:hypothetical protein
MTKWHLLAAGLTLTAGSAIVGLPNAAGAAPKPAPVPQYVVEFSAIAAPPSSTALDFHSTSCAIGPATNPIVVLCDETGTIKFTNTGGSGTATVTSALSSINWRFKLHRSSVSSTMYQMVGKGTESDGASPIVRLVRVSGTFTLTPTPDPTFQGTEEVFPLPIPVD